jgi:sugar phosphate isomerase/epimerase
MAPFRFCLNTATIRGQKLGIVKEVEVATKAGYQAIEPWVSSLEDYSKQGGSLSDLKKQIADSGLTVESAIAFPAWIAEDPAQRSKGMEQAKREMDLVAQIGGKRLAAPPVGATDKPGLDLMQAAERYRALLEAGDQIGVVPELELWGFSKNLHLLSECAYVAIQTGHPKACILTDMFHLYKGGTDFQSLKLLSRNALQVFHTNDYPADPPREKINDGYRVFPGEGTAPLVEVLRLFRSLGGQTILSLEVFNKKYWEQDALEAARTGLERMRAVAEQA